MHNMCEKYVEQKIYEPKTEHGKVWKKAFLNSQYWMLAVSEYDFLKIDKNHFLLSQNDLYVSYDAPNYMKSLLGL